MRTCRVCSYRCRTDKFHVCQDQIRGHSSGRMYHSYINNTYRHIVHRCPLLRHSSWWSIGYRHRRRNNSHSVLSKVNILWYSQTHSRMSMLHISDVNIRSTGLDHKVYPEHKFLWTSLECILRNTQYS